NGVKILDGVKNPAVLVKALLDTDDSVLALALSGDGKKLVSGGCDRLVRIWDLGGGVKDAKLEQSIENHADWVFGVAFSPDSKYGKQLAAGSWNGEVRVWNTADAALVRAFNASPGYVPVKTETPKK